MTPQETLNFYLAIKLHFSNPSYDYFKYKGQLKAAPDFKKRKDHYQIAKLARQADPKGMIIANLSVNPNIWLGEIVSDKGIKQHKAWQKRLESLSYCFKEELKKLHTDFDSNFLVPPHEHPYAMRLFLGEHLSLETLVILNSLTGFYKSWNKQLQDDIAWKEIYLLIPKYTPFLNMDSKKFKDIVMEQFDG